jgi:hypothetical protein
MLKIGMTPADVFNAMIAAAPKVGPSQFSRVPQLAVNGAQICDHE